MLVPNILSSIVFIYGQTLIRGGRYGLIFRVGIRIFQWGVFFYSNQCQKYENNLFFGFNAISTVSTPKNGSKLAKMRKQSFFGDFFALFLPDFQNVGIQIFRQASNFQKKYQKFFEKTLRSPKMTKNFKFLIFFHQKVEFQVIYRPHSPSQIFKIFFLKSNSFCEDLATNILKIR